MVIISGVPIFRIFTVTFIVKYCPLTSAFGACNFSLINYDRKIFPSHPNIGVFERMAQISFHTLNGVNNAPR